MRLRTRCVMRRPRWRGFAQRTREIGIRMALGARATSVARTVIGHALKLTGLGLAAGIAGSFAVRKILTTLVFQVSTADPWIYAGVAVLMVAAAVLAGYLPARRAAR